MDSQAAYRERNRDMLRAKGAVYRTTEGFRTSTRKHLLAKYGLTISEYEKIYANQDGKCHICNKEETHIIKGSVSLLKVDHDHATGLVRGLLCNQCNLRIGRLLEDPEWTEKALGYINSQKSLRDLLAQYHYPVGGRCNTCTDFLADPEPWPCPTITTVESVTIKGDEKPKGSKE